MRSVRLGARLKDLSDPAARAVDVDVVALAVDGAVVEGAEVPISAQVALDLRLGPRSPDLCAIGKVVGAPRPGALEVALLHLPLRERRRLAALLGPGGRRA